MTETHKAAVEALESYLRKCDFHGHRVLSKPMPTDADVQRFRSALESLKQPSSVEVTVEKKQYYRSREFYIEYFASVLCRMDDLDPKRWREGSETFEWTEFEQHAECILDAILQDFPSALRITRAAATDGVKS